MCFVLDFAPQPAAALMNLQFWKIRKIKLFTVQVEFYRLFTAMIFLTYIHLRFKTFKLYHEQWILVAEQCINAAAQCISRKYRFCLDFLCILIITANRSLRSLCSDNKVLESDWFLKSAQTNRTPATRPSYFVNHLYCYRPNWASLCPVTIIYTEVKICTNF